MSGAPVLNRALLVWGLGHLALGDRRGWLLLAAQPVILAAAAVATVQLVDGTRWLAVFPLLAAIIAVWLAQAVHAHRHALERGRSPGGELKVMLFLAAAALVLTGYWLVGGRHGSPSATLGAYLEAWRSGRPEMAAPLFVLDPLPDQIRAAWTDHDARLRADVARAAASHGRDAGLDPAQPFDSLRFTQTDSSAATGSAAIAMDLVRLQRVESQLLGVIPTASQQTVVIARQMVVRFALLPEPGLAWLPSGLLDSWSWQITSIDLV